MGLDMHALWMGGMPLKPEMRKAYVRNCFVHADHGYATPMHVVRHYTFPQPLQVLVFGEVKDDRHEWLCPIGHDNVDTLIREYVEADPRMEHWAPEEYRARAPLSAHPDEVVLAIHGLRRYRAALDGMAELRAKGPWAVHPNDWRCPGCGGGMLLTSAGGKTTWSHTCTEGSVAFRGLQGSSQA